MNNDSNKIWTKNFVIICTVNFLLFTSFYFLLTTLPKYIINYLHGNQQDVGYVTFAVTITAVLIRPLSGYLYDFMGRKMILFWSLILYSLSVFSYIFGSYVVLLLIIRAIHGFSWGFTTTGTSTLASDLIPANKRGVGFGIFGITITLAMAVGPLLSLWMFNNFGPKILFLSAFIIVLLSSFLLLTIKTNEIKKPDQKFTIKNIFERKIIDLAMIVFFVGITYGGIVSFITLFAKQLGVENEGLFFFVFAISLLVTRPFGGRIFDLNGPKSVVSLGFGLFFISFILLFLSKGIILFLISALFFGLAFGFYSPSINAMAINAIEPSKRGSANSTIMTANDLGIGLGSIFLGFLSEKFGMANMYLFCCLILLIPLIIFVRKRMK